MSKSGSAPSAAFISYSWDDEDHKAWVRGLAERLRADGVDATLDQWAAAPGDQLPSFMERSVAQSSFVLIICTPRYKGRSEKRVGGVGYEGDIITAELMQHRNRRKFIPVLRRGTWEESAPGWILGSYYIDLRDGGRFDAQYEDLLSTVRGVRPEPPPLGAGARSRRERIPMNAQSQSDYEEEPIRIVGVIADEVTEPRLDGTIGSALYRVPFRLSRRASPDWGSVFEQVWNRPPHHTGMHRSGIARVAGDRIVLDGTTIEEVQECHRDTLVLCVRETNRIVDEQEAKARREREAREQALDEHRQRVKDVSGELEFDD